MLKASTFRELPEIAHRARPILTLLVLALTLIASGCVTKITDADKTATASAIPQPTATHTTGAAAVFDGIPTDVGRSDNALITGAGSTFAQPLYTRWASDYRTNVAPGVQMNYQGIGSGGGIQQIQQQIVDFGASDAPMTDFEESQAAGPVQHIPTALGAVAVTYNLKGLSAPLRFDGPTLAKVFLGQIKKWNDAAITGLNPGVSLPDADITVVHRAEGSGTSYIFADYLAHEDADWLNGPGVSKNPVWPVGLGGNGSAGVTALVQQNQGSISYVELGWALLNNLPIAQMKHAKTGEFITPTSQSTSLAAEGVSIPADYRVSIVDSPTAGAYPISGFTWILMYKDQTGSKTAKGLVDLLWWAIHDGQSVEASLGYAPLPAPVVKMLEKTLTTDITADGHPLLQTSAAAPTG